MLLCTQSYNKKKYYTDLYVYFLNKTTNNRLTKITTIKIKTKLKGYKLLYTLPHYIARTLQNVIKSQYPISKQVSIYQEFKNCINALLKKCSNLLYVKYYINYEIYLHNLDKSTTFATAKWVSLARPAPFEPSRTGT